MYGKRIRQPIGGDFAISRDVAKYYIEQDVWDTDVARFGIDIWMTTSAVTHGFRICQSNLGVKIHDVKDPGQHLGPMFRQVLSALFTLMEKYESVWKKVKGSQPLDLFGYEGTLEPEPVNVNLDLMIEQFKTGYQQFSVLWKEIFCQECFEAITEASEQDNEKFHIATETWIKMLYELAATYHLWSANRNKKMTKKKKKNFGRVASFVRQSWDMSSTEAEALVEEQAIKFEEQKDYLIKVWDEKSAEKMQQ